MSDILIIAGITLGIVVIAIMGWYIWKGVPPGSRVIQEKAVNSDGLEENQAKFMFFYTTWCPHCKKAHQPWASFKEFLKTKRYGYGGKQILFEDVNAESDKGKAALYKINAYPTFKVETTENMYEMVGPPSVSTFRAFLTDALGPEKPI